MGNAEDEDTGSDASPAGGDGPVQKDESGYRVGRGKPPVHTRYTKGQSGNLKGRPRNKPNLASLIQAELDAKMKATIDGKTRWISKRELLARQWVARTIKGDAKIGRLLIALDRPPEEPVVVVHTKDGLSPDDHAFLLDQLTRLKGE